jgi:hypothetical protein
MIINRVVLVRLRVLYIYSRAISHSGRMELADAYYESELEWNYAGRPHELCARVVLTVLHDDPVKQCPSQETASMVKGLLRDNAELRGSPKVCEARQRRYSVDLEHQCFKRSCDHASESIMRRFCRPRRGAFQRGRLDRPHHMYRIPLCPVLWSISRQNPIHL